MKTISRETFAIWSFERDRKEGGYRKSMIWDRLSTDEKQVYRDEAEYYMSGNSEIGWPNDILERAEKEGYSLP